MLIKLYKYYVYVIYSLDKHLTVCSCSFPPINMGEGDAMLWQACHYSKRAGIAKVIEKQELHPHKTNGYISIHTFVL